MDQGVDAGIHFFFCFAQGAACMQQLVGEFRSARFHHLGHPVENLSAVVGGSSTPPTESSARSGDGVA